MSATAAVADGALHLGAQPFVARTTSVLVLSALLRRPATSLDAAR